MVTGIESFKEWFKGTCDRISTITPPGSFSIRNGVSGCCLTYDEVKE